MKLLNMEEYDKISEECRELSVKKNADYGCDTILVFDTKGLVVRLYDKMERLRNLIWNNNMQNVKDETIEDTAKDMVNYAKYLVMLNRKRLVK